MKPKNLPIILTAFLLLRIIISIVLSDGKLQSDSVNYAGLAFNIAENGTFTAVVPADDSVFAGGVSVDSFFGHFQNHPVQFRRLMSYQWFHSLAYLPVLLVFRSLYAIVIVNNLLLFGACYFLFDIIRKQIDRKTAAAGWFLFLFFPPFFYLTNQFFSEPLFIFFLSYIVNRIVLQKPLTISFIAALILLSITRGFGLFVTAGFVFTALAAKEWKNGSAYVVCGLAAIGFNMVSGAGVRDDRFITVDSPPPVMHLVYFANTVHGNGDTDYFLEYPKLLNDDPYFVQHRTGNLPVLGVSGELARQFAQNPLKFLTITWNKISAYFLNVIPDSWAYGTPPQPLHRKIFWGIINIALIGMIWKGLRPMPDRFRRYFAVLFWVSLGAHIIALSRYRYFLPVAAAGFPAAVLFLGRMMDRFGRFKNNDALPP